MSHVTQCPACSTHFRVVADQLKISDGWVRCGQCGEVFDAKVSMQPWPLVLPAEPDTAAPNDAAANAVAAPDVSQPADAAVSFAAEDVALWPLEMPDVPLSGSTPEGMPEPAVEKQPARADLRAEPEPEPGPDVAFVREAKRRALWQQPWVRALLVLSVVVLGLLLLAQVVLHQRHRLAAAYPDVASGLQALCEPFGCTIEPYRQIESVLIDSSALVREREDLYRLEVGLKNTSGLVLAVPALELSLTNTADEVVLRRVLLPTDWEASPEALVPHASAALTVRLSLSAASELRMAGYRALVFYP